MEGEGRKSSHKIRPKSTVWAKGKQEIIMTFNSLSHIFSRTFVSPLEKVQKTNKGKKKLPVTC